MKTFQITHSVINFQKQTVSSNTFTLDCKRYNYRKGLIMRNMKTIAGKEETSVNQHLFLLL